MATVTTPAFLYNGPAAEAFVPTDSGATIRCPKGKYVAGSYYTGILTTPSWTTVADVTTIADPTLIVYENMGELGNKLVFVPVPATSDAAGNAGDIAIVADSVTGITKLYLCTVTGADGDAAWDYFEAASWPA
jgi:hypothetical protein